MRIALVSREVSPFFGAGIGAYAAAMARAWARVGHEVHVISAPHGGFLARGPAELGGAFCHAVTPDLTPEFEVHPSAFMRHAMGVYRLLKQLHEKTPLDYIEFPDYWAEGCFAIRAKRTIGAFETSVLGVRLHTPTRECRALNEECLLDEDVASMEHCEESAIREADIVLSPSRSLLAMLTARLGLRVPSRVIPYPFEVPDLQAVSRNGSARPTVLYYGRLERRKGVHLLIQAAQRLLARGVDVDFRFIGGDTATGPAAGSMREHLQQSIADAWKGRISIEGPRPKGEILQLVRAGAAAGGVCCFPSLWENYPNVCLEAMSAGATVVGSDAGGMSEMIEDGVSGLLFRAGDSKSLEDALARALGDAGLRETIHGAAPHRVRTLCDPERVVHQMVEAIGTVAPTRPITAHPAAGAGSDVSIIIPFYNLSPYLPDALRSIRKQTVPPLEVIVVDDGSTESEAPALLARVESGEFGPVRVIRKENGGLSSARNAGLAAARGSWVLPLDADDILDQRFLELTLRAAERDPSLGLITTSVIYFFDFYPQERGVWVPLGLVRDILSTTNCASSCTALLDRRTVLDVGGYDTSLRSYEDWDLYCRLALRGVRSTIIPDPLIRYRLRSDSMMRTIGISRRQELHAQILARYPALAETPERAMRILQSRAETAEVRAREIIRENIRYRIADKVNVVLKRTGMQRAVKGIASRVFRMREEAGS